LRPEEWTHGTIATPTEAPVTSTSPNSLTTLRGRALLAIAASCLGVAPAAAERPSDIEDSWPTDDHKGVVRIGPCGDKLCGRIAQVLDRTPGIPRTDVNNPDLRLRSQPLVGLLTLAGFSRRGTAWQGGRAYDPKSGKNYRSTLQLEPNGSLKVTGCVLFICEARYWTRLGQRQG
jgi:uncharacterized protein (DUF2147 family)